MSDLGNTIRQNTDEFYYQKEQDAIAEYEFYQDLFAKSLNGIQANLEMFDELGAFYILNNVKGKAVLNIEVLLFDEEVEAKLVLTLFGEYKEEDYGKYLSYYIINAGLDTTRSGVYYSSQDLSIAYSNEILTILETRELKEFLNNFDTLYEQTKTK
jgi:hypothetical protein